MTDSIIYIPTIIMCDYFERDEFQEHFKKTIATINPPDGFVINEIKFMSDDLVFPLLDDFIDKNNPTPAPNFHSENFLLKITLLFEEELLYKKLLWLEDGIRETVNSFDSVCGVLSFYHVEEGKKLETVCQMKAFKNDLLDEFYTESFIDGDFSYVLTYSDLLRQHYYSEGPDFSPTWQSAKYLLTYGDPSYRKAEEPA